MDKKVITTNRKAFHDYTIFDKYVAGIVLTGTEIKSIRKNAINLKDSFCKIEDNEIFLYNCHISPYEQGNRCHHVCRIVFYLWQALFRALQIRAIKIALVELLNIRLFLLLSAF